MSHETCPHENDVMVAARSGEWSHELRIHRDGCLGCAELTLVAAALASDAEMLTDEAIPLPDPGMIWMRAQLAEREHKYLRATRAIVWVQRTTIAVVAAIGLAFAPGLWGLIQRVFSGFSLASPFSDLPRAAGSPMLVLLVSGLILGALALWEMTAAQQN